jgi:hypothetical protein
MRLRNGATAPYVLDGLPVKAETTVNVVFKQAG